MNQATKDDCLEISHGFLNFGLLPYQTKQKDDNPRRRLFLAFYPGREKGKQEILYCLSFNDYSLAVLTGTPDATGRAGSYEGYARTDEHAIYCVRELVIAFMNGSIIEEIDV